MMMGIANRQPGFQSDLSIWFGYRHNLS